MSNEEERKKLIDKIHKCLRLSKSSEPHEAAAALRQAQKLMAVHAISEEDVLGREIFNKLFVTRAPYQRKLQMAFCYMLSIVNKAFGTECVVEAAYVKGKARTAFRYFGPEAQVEMAVYTHTVLDRAIWSAWNEYRVDKPWLANERGARMGFWLGWLEQVRSTVIDFYGTKKEAQEEARAAGGTNIVPLDEGEQQRAKSNKAISTHYGNQLGQTKQNTMVIHGTTHRAGKEAAKDFQLHRPINGDRQRQLTN